MVYRLGAELHIRSHKMGQSGVMELNQGSDKYDLEGATREMQAKPAGDAEVTLWYCPQCKGSGALIVAPTTEATVVADEIGHAHQLAGTECHCMVRWMHVVRPNGWYDSIVNLLHSRHDGRFSGMTARLPAQG